MAQDQTAVFALLQDPATYGRRDKVLRIDTHGAVVFLAGPDVYKVKRAVRFSFMDFSTLEKRYAACLAELVVNHDNAPGLYLGVVPITRDGGQLRLGGPGPVAEWAVHLRRFDENATLDRLAAHHLHALLQDTVDDLVAGDDVFPRSQSVAYGAALTAAFAQMEGLLSRRGAKGQVRRCHGDLHLGNLMLIDGVPVLYDALEFDDAIATCDVLYDLAFLLMDLCKFGRVADANLLLDDYLAFSADEDLQIEGVAALPLFLSLRAAIRAKVNAALWRLDATKPRFKDQALAYFDRAKGFLGAPPLQSASCLRIDSSSARRWSVTTG